MKIKIITITMLVLIVIITILLAINVNIKKDSKLNILTSFYPMYIAALNVTDGAGNVEVSNLTYVTTGCIHDYVLTTTEMVKLANADVLIINGAGMEGFMDKVITNFSDLNIIDTSQGIQVITDCEEEHHEHEHNHETNPHIFVSVKNYIKQVRNICDELVKIDSLNKEKYEKNTREYIAKLENLDNNIEESISDLEQKNIVTFHNTFDYFAKDYGLNIVSTIENEHGKTPGAHEIAEIIEKIKTNEIKAIFVEPEYNIKLVETISKETGTKIYTLNPVTSGDNNKETYIKTMEKNLEVLKEALK